MQNVIWRIVELSVQDVDSIDFVQSRLKSTTEVDLRLGNNNITYIEPIAGCEAIIICEEYRVYQ